MLIWLQTQIFCYFHHSDYHLFSTIQCFVAGLTWGVGPDRCRIQSSCSRCIVGMKIAQMNSLTSSHLIKACLGVGNNSMAMDETFDAEVFGMCKFEPPLRDLALKLMHCEGQWFELRSRHMIWMCFLLAFLFTWLERACILRACILSCCVDVNSVISNEITR